MLLRTVTGTGAALVMDARRVERALRTALDSDGALLIRAIGFWVDAESGEPVFLQVNGAPVSKIGTRQILVALRDGDCWIKPDAEGSYVEFRYEPSRRMPQLPGRVPQRRSKRRYT